MADIRKLGATSNTIRVALSHVSTGDPLTGLAYNSAGLIISAIADNEASVGAGSRYRADNSEVEDITALGTFAAPSANKCRFKEIDATNHPGLYELQFLDARFAVSNARRLVVTISGAANLKTVHYEVIFDPDANVTKINSDATAAANWAKAAGVVYAGSITGASPTTTTLVDSGLTQADTDFWQNRIIIFTSGALKYQMTPIAAFTPASDTLTFAALTSAPAQNDTYIIV